MITHENEPIDHYDDLDDFGKHKDEIEACFFCGEVSCYHCPECGHEPWDDKPHTEVCPYYEPVKL